MSAQANMLAVLDRVQFAPCDGFGDEGRSATLLDAAGECIGGGYGATDDEAVLEALVDAGLSFDAAFDYNKSALIAEARRWDNEPSDDYIEFPNGEFPPQANVGPLA
jgi:hypothetical protein